MPFCLEIVFKCDFIFLIMQHRMDASVKSKKDYLLVSAIDFGTTIQDSPSLLEMISWDPAAAHLTHWVDMTSSLISKTTSKIHSIWQRMGIQKLIFFRMHATLYLAVLLRKSVK